MGFNDELKIDHLVSKLQDEGLEQGELHQLEQLVSSNASLRRRYLQLVSLHVTLKVAATTDRPATQSGGHRFAGLLAEPARRPNSSRRRWVWTALPVAAAVAVALVVAALLPQENTPLNGPAFTQTAPATWEVDRLPAIAKVSWDGPIYERDTKQWVPVNARRAGIVPLYVRSGISGNGYLFCLEPGDSVQLVATFDATGENGIAISEIDMHGDLDNAVREVTFHNTGNGPRPRYYNPKAVNRSYGVLGDWSESNTSNTRRYFLMTGLHRLIGADAGDDYRLSDMAVELEHDDVVHVGWDDSGLVPIDKPETASDLMRDRDFDDVAATLFFKRATPQPTFASDQLEVIRSDRKVANDVPTDLQHAYKFTIAPGDSLVLKATRSIRTQPMKFYVLELPSKRVLWSRSNQLPKQLSLGVSCIRNETDKPREIAIVSTQLVNNKWVVSKSQTLYEQHGYIIFGFQSGGPVNFKDIRFNVMTQSARESLK